MLKTLYAPESKARIMHLRFKLNDLKKGAMTMGDYLLKIKNISDALVAAGEPLFGSDLIYQTLEELPSDFEHFTTTVLTRLDCLSYDEMQSLLLQQEIKMLRACKKLTDFSLDALAHLTSKGWTFKNNNQPGRPPFSDKDSEYIDKSPNKSTRRYKGSPCQICNHPNHSVLTCKSCFDASIKYTPRKPSAYMATSPPSTDHSWYLNSGATHQVTNDLNNLKLHNTGPEQLQIGNGTSLKIHHIGTTSLSSSNKNLVLHDNLHVSDITNNFLSVARFTSDNDVFLEFHPSHVLVKDRKSKKVLLQGSLDHGVYRFSHDELLP
ncbi:PREDICTED: uncharacterized protein LOC104602078 [Nelumbo nucifera]|uniref:Uncharacterized protein LOC104602078 n=1 Tax=Nelumbo nucifera TaxID=4432 RepID=A0A1U8A984_NELNU|nr:PREDICTED: uncharacterized protein LOC104602078 [Nelumbo nucifera]